MIVIVKDSDGRERRFDPDAETASAWLALSEQPDLDPLLKAAFEQFAQRQRTMWGM